MTLRWSAAFADCGMLCDDAKARPMPVMDAACGSRPTIPCDGYPRSTDHELARLRLRVAARCCKGAHLVHENRLTVFFDDGCARGFTMGGYDEAPAVRKLVECVARVLSGRRIACARSTACAWFETSTVK